MRCFAVRLLLCLFLHACENSLLAEPHSPVNYLGIEHGLSNNAVTCIYKDHQGFMWFGTYNGLNRYDGYAFRVFRNGIDDTTSLIHNWILTVKEDSRHDIWVGTRQGVCRYNSRSGNFSAVPYLPYGSNAPQKIQSLINDIETDAQGHVFMGTDAHGLLVYKNNMAVQIPYGNRRHPVLDYGVKAIKNDQAGNTWLLIQDIGLCLYDVQRNEIKLVNSQLNNANCMTAMNGQLWIGSEAGLYCYDIAANSFRVFHAGSNALTRNNVVSLCPDARGHLWIGTNGGGINILDKAAGTFSYLAPGQHKGALTSGSVDALYLDEANRMWIGTLRGGINLIDPLQDQFKTIAQDPFSRNSVADNFILSFCEDELHNVWIGTDGGGLSYWDRRNNRYTNFTANAAAGNGLSSGFITSIVNDFEHTIWLATWDGGINRYNKNSQTFSHYTCGTANAPNRNVWLLYEDKARNLWAATVRNGELYRLNRQTNRFEIFDSELRDVLSLFEDKQGILWAGTSGQQLIRIDPVHKQHQRFAIGYAVRSIYEDVSGNFWIGTEGGGLLQFNRSSGQFTRFGEKNGLCNNSVLNILEDRSHHLWLSTFNGLSKFDIAAKSFENFSQSDGLQSNQFNYNAALALHSGELLFGGIKGFNIFYPDSIQPVNHTGQVLVTGLRINNESFNGSYNDAIVLPYNKATLAVDFVRPEYSTPDKIAYAYYLEGWDKNWNYTGHIRTANYSRLTEGNYLLHIKSTNANGTWSGLEKQLHIVVLPPWFRTWWAYLLYVLTGAAAVALFILYKTRQARLKYEIQLAHLQAKKEEELHEKKLAFFTNITHEFRTPLTLIINPVKDRLIAAGSRQESNDLHIVYRNARRLLGLVDQLLLFRKADTEGDKLQLAPVNFYHLCREVYLCFVQQAKTKNIDYRFECAHDDIPAYADAQKIEIALYNLISNALKFTPEGGTVVFRVTETARNIEVQVTDTGYGIPAGTGDKLFEKFYQVSRQKTQSKPGFGIGLYLVKHFIESHNGKVSYQSEPGKGTCFTVHLSRGAVEQAVNTGQPVAPPAIASFLPDDELVLPAAEPSVPADSQPSLDELLTGEQCLLVIDDDKQLCDYLAGIFKQQFKVYKAFDGETGLKLAKEHLPDIIISDVLMQGINGMELCRTIKNDPALSHIPVILLTASSSTEGKLQGVEHGADDYLTKPFEKELLVARVANLLKNRNQLQKYFYNEITLQQNNLKISEEYKLFMERCIAIVEKHFHNESFTIKTLAHEMRMSHSNLYKKIKSISGQSVNGFIRFIRLRKAAELFINTNYNVTETAYQVGISDIKYFREQFYKLFGLKPLEYIKKYRKVFNEDYTLNKEAFHANDSAK